MYHEKDLINQLRRRLKSREEDVRGIEQRAEDLAKAKALLSTGARAVQATTLFFILKF